MKRILVTGATGFLGSHLARALIGRGFQVVATGRNISKAPAGPEGALLFIPADLSNGSDVRRLEAAAGTLDAVVHAAALSAPWGPRQAFHSANVAATRNILDLARSNGTERLVYISTPSIYFRFQDQFGVRETDPLPPPVNRYSESKRMAEELVIQRDDLASFILRPRGLYGRGDTALLPRLVHAAKRRPLPLLRGGKAVTDLTHVEDAVDAAIAAIDAPADAAGIYNISGGEPQRLVDVIELACGRSGVKVRWRPTPVRAALAAARAMELACACLPGRPEPPVTAYGVGVLAFSQTLDIEKARRELGWSPRIGFDEGLDLTFGSAVVGP
ncbi:MAG TPA: NAD(P)-dependent oxidoreductase [Allosphingosinicella sp.]|nr:NAD(P)-dependent oxidoreductase [Allosphingosinicella sp.]